jgi:hypothetical protein
MDADPAYAGIDDNELEPDNDTGIADLDGLAEQTGIARGGFSHIE